MKIAMGNDHTAIELKNIIKEFVEGKGYEVIDLGTNSTESCDYPVPPCSDCRYHGTHVPPESSPSHISLRSRPCLLTRAWPSGK